MPPLPITPLIPPPWPRRVASLAVLFLLYQSAEGLGAKLLHSFPLQAGLMCAALLAAWPVSRWLGYRKLGAFALEPRPGAAVWLVAGVLLATLAKFGAVLAGLELGVYLPAADSAPVAAATVAASLPLLLVSTLVPSLAEDILTRGFFYRAAGIHWRHGLAFVATSSALYVANHLYRLQLGPMEWLLLSVYGLAYATALWRTGTLWAALGLHWGWNLGNGLSEQWLPASTADATGSALLSIGAHLLLLLAVVAATGRERDAAPHYSR